MKKLKKTIWLLLVGLANSLSSAPPNVVVFLSDDQGWGDLSLNGNKDLSTPNIDSLARDGARFDRFYVCPVCSPTRAEFLTGRYHPRGGVYSTSAGGERLDLDERTIAQAFRAAGYATGAFGKWHNGTQWPYHPNARGFDEFYGFCSGHWGHYFSPLLDHNGKVVKGDGYVIDDFTTRALDFIESNQEQPFFVYLPYNTPHSPMQVPDRWWKKFANKKLQSKHRNPKKEDDLHKRAALAMCENIDWNVGRVLEKLDALKLGDNTIVLYFCDNGPNGNRWNGGMKGRKGSTDEGGVRSPLLIRWPAAIRAGTQVKPNAAAIDLLPTLCDLAGIEPGNLKPLDGRSLKPLLISPLDQLAKTTWPERHLFSCWRNNVAVRRGRFCLDAGGELFNLENDPGQRTPVTARHPALTADLRAAVKIWRENILSELQPDKRAFVVGHPEAIWTPLPARDATTEGQIERSNRFPNDSFFRNWTSTEEQIHWNCQVPADGRFRVHLFYTCPKEDIGSKIELSFGEARLVATLNQPGDSRLVGAAEDRKKRAESYVQNWQETDLGVINLTAGKGNLTLRALEVPGSKVMDFRMLQLERLIKSD